MENKLESGFAIKNILLMDSNLHRINNVHFGEGVENSLDINTGVSVSGNKIFVSEEANYSWKYNNEEQVQIRVKMLGVFESIGESPIKDFEQFGRINGASIIFPFIREHITTLALKAGLGAIIVPPVNFVNAVKQ